MNDYTLHLVKKAYYKKQLIKQAVDGMTDEEFLAELDASKLKQRADDQRDFILGTQRAEGMALGGAAGGAAGGLGGYYGGRALARKLGLNDKSWKSRALRYGLGTAGAVGGAYLGGKLGHSGTKALQDKLIQRYDYGRGDGADNVALFTADTGNKFYKKYNI